ncbi:MAG: hypothetical protein M1826_003176 [Phylliscum demangeonii]|nr:MAG: hypothetical protein M1826_003176 [Phylliscum demangeonii]
MHAPSFVLAGLWLVAMAIHAAPTRPVDDPYIITDSEINETDFSDHKLMNCWIIAIRPTETDHAKMEISQGKSPEDADRDFKSRVQAIPDQAKHRRDDASRNTAKQKTPPHPRPEEKEHQADLKRIEDESTAPLVEALRADLSPSTAPPLKEKERGMPLYVSPIGNTYEALATLHNDLIATAEKNARGAVSRLRQVMRAMKPVAKMVLGTHHLHRASSSLVGRTSVTGGPLSAADLDEVWLNDPTQFSLFDYNPFDILGVNARAVAFPDHDALYEAYTRARQHTRSFATSSTLPLPLPAPAQAALAYRTLTGPYRVPARAFWRAHHRSTWNPHAAVDSVEAGRPIPGQARAEDNGGGVLMAAAVIAIEADAVAVSSSMLLGPYHPPRGSERTDGYCVTNCWSLPPAGQGVFYLWFGGGGGPPSFPTLPAVLLGTFRLSLEEGNERAIAVVGVLDRRGRYYRRIMPCTMAGDCLPPDDLNIAHSCSPGWIDYLPRFRDWAEVQVMGVVREELARLQAQVDDARALTGREGTGREPV